jgi:hypothetical protein
LGGLINLTGITKTLLARAIKNHVNQGDPETARNYIKTWGPHIKGYNVEEELQKFEAELQKLKKKSEKEELKDV